MLYFFFSSSWLGLGRSPQSTTAQQHTKGIWNMDMGPQHENATFGCLYRAAKLPQTIKLIVTLTLFNLVAPELLIISTRMVISYAVLSSGNIPIVSMVAVSTLGRCDYLSLIPSLRAPPSFFCKKTKK